VGTGVGYAWIPTDVLDHLHATPQFYCEFVTTDGPVRYTEMAVRVNYPRVTSADRVEELQAASGR